MKCKKLFLSFRGLIVSSLIAVGDSRWMVNNDQPNRTIEKVEQIDKRVVAYLKGRSEKFISLEKAVEYADSLPKENDSSYTVVLKPGTCIVTSSFTIDSNVKVLLSFDGEQESTSKPDKDGKYSSVDGLSGKEMMNSQVVVRGTEAKETVITNKGIIEIGGELSGSNGGNSFAGQTAGRYSEIVLSEHSSIINSGTIDCYGYIKEGRLEKNTKNGTQEITYTHLGVDNKDSGYVKNIGGNFNLPFILRDYRGGSSMTAIGNSIDTDHVPPFNQFELRNVTCKIDFDYYSHAVGWANLRTGEALGGAVKPQRNSTSVRLLGLPVHDENEGDLAFIIEPSDLTFKLAFYFDPSTEIEEIDVYGGSNTNARSLSVSIGVVNKTISTENVFFPLSFRQHVVLHKNESQDTAQYNRGQRFKMLPGSYFEISQGSVLNANEFCVYKENDFIDTKETVSVGGTHYPSGKGDAKFVVNGELRANIFGGFCYTYSSLAKAVIIKSANIVSLEAKTQEGSAAFPLGLKIKDKITVSKFLSRNHLEHIHKDEFSVQDNLPIGNYFSVQQNSKFGFVTNKTLYDIKYHHIAPDNAFDESLVHDSGNITVFCQETKVSLSLMTYQGDEYLCSSFFFDRGMTEKVDVIDSSALNKIDSNKDLNLYVKWIAPKSDKYSLTITKTIQNPDNKKNQQVVNGSSSKYLVGDAFSLEKQTSYELITDLNPKGSTKATETIKIFTFSGYSVVITDANGNQIEKYSVDINGNSSDGFFHEFQCTETSTFEDGYIVTATALYSESSVNFTLSMNYTDNIAKGSQGDAKLVLSDTSYKDRLTISWTSSNTDNRTVQSNSSWETKVTNKYVRDITHWGRTATVTLSCDILLDGTKIGNLKSGNITLQGK